MSRRIHAEQPRTPLFASRVTRARRDRITTRSRTTGERCPFFFKSQARAHASDTDKVPRASVEPHLSCRDYRKARRPTNWSAVGRSDWTDPYRAPETGAYSRTAGAEIRKVELIRVSTPRCPMTLVPSQDAALSSGV